MPGACGSTDYQDRPHVPSGLLKSLVDNQTEAAGQPGSRAANSLTRPLSFKIQLQTCLLQFTHPIHHLVLFFF